MRHPASASLPLASRWPLPQQLLPVSATGCGRRRCPKGGAIGRPGNFPLDAESPIWRKSAGLAAEGSGFWTSAPCQAVAGLDSGALPFPGHRALLVQTKADRHANGSPSGRAGAERLRGQGCCQTALHCDRIALTKSLPIAARRLSGDGLALSVTPAACHLSQGERLWRTGRRKKAPLEVATPRGFFLFGVTILTLDIPDFSIPDSPQKSSAAQKVYKRPLRRFAPAPLVGEPLAKRRSFTECQGLPSVGEVASRQR